ncbi:hypothetical protein HN451_07940, partial [archaeon]|nr:hypothetical protein [archaeon]
CWNFEHNESYFNGSEEQINITFKPNWPYSYAMMNFITPNEVGWYFDEKIRLKGEDYQEDIDKIHKMMSAKLYLLDSISSESKTKEYWTLPTESLSKMQLDCEDWATSFISLMKNFDPEIKCFNVGVPWHLTTFCKYDEKYVFFDQNNFMIKTYVRDDYPYSKKYDKVRNWVETFFDSFGYPSYLWIVESAFDEKNYYEFEHRKDFIKWAIEQ